MKIFGIGTDIINIKRMEKTLKNNNPNFKNRIFSKNEINYCEKKKNHYSLNIFLLQEPNKTTI